MSQRIYQRPQRRRYTPNSACLRSNLYAGSAGAPTHWGKATIDGKVFEIAGWRGRAGDGTPQDALTLTPVPNEPTQHSSSASSCACGGSILETDDLVLVLVLVRRSCGRREVLAEERSRGKRRLHP
jgi:hypothetical protein